VRLLANCYTPFTFTFTVGDRRQLDSHPPVDKTVASGDVHFGKLLSESYLSRLAAESGHEGYMFCCCLFIYFYLFIFNDSCQINYAIIYRTDLCQNFQHWYRTMAVDDQPEI